MSKPTELQRLLNNTPSPAHSDAKLRLAGFAEVMEPFDLRHVQRAVSMILAGDAEGVDPKFAIYPPMLATICRQLRDRELTQDYRHRGAVLQIMARDRPEDRDPPEVRRAAVAAGLARLFDPAKVALTDAEVTERKAEQAQYLEKHDRFFVPDQSDDAMRKRLLKPR